MDYFNSDNLYYFAHPYTCKDEKGNNLLKGEEVNFNLCCIRSAELLKRGFAIYSPICHTHPIHVGDSEFLKNNEYKLWMELDSILTEKCSAIILAPEWMNSSGCKKEREFFKEKGLDIWLYEDIIRNYPIIYNKENQPIL